MKRRILLEKVSSLGFDVHRRLAPAQSERNIESNWNVRANVHVLRICGEPRAARSQVIAIIRDVGEIKAASVVTRGRADILGNRVADFNGHIRNNGAGWI